MKIRNKILIYFSSTVIALSAISFVLIYLLFSEYREEEFQQQQNEKIKYTIGLITDFKDMSEELSFLMDEQNINDFYDEKLLVFDSQKDLIFSSLDDLPITHSNEILNQLSPSKRWIETKDGNYDLIGVYVENNGKSYYAISKAYDEFGYSKMYYLRTVLTGLFIAITVIVLFVSFFLSNAISKPITRLAEQLTRTDLSSEKTVELDPDTSSYELNYLTDRFNELLRRTNTAFSFQRHTIHHISHELKTPVAVLVSELEKTKNTIHDPLLESRLDNLVNKAKSLGEIINVLLEISKIESGQDIQKTKLRTDEILFDLISELASIYPDFHFEIRYTPDTFNEDRLILTANKMLLKQAFLNLLTNCVTYGTENRAEIHLDCSSPEQLRIAVINHGNPVSKEEENYLFHRFFRGENSRGKLGFGLGLVLTQRIIRFHNGSVSYQNPSGDENIFEVVFTNKV